MTLLSRAREWLRRAAAPPAAAPQTAPPIVREVAPCGARRYGYVNVNGPLTLRISIEADPAGLRDKDSTADGMIIQMVFLLCVCATDAAAGIAAQMVKDGLIAGSDSGVEQR